MYIKEGFNISLIRDEHKQVFENKFNINIGQKEIVKMKSNGVITDRDLSISKFLFKFRFATLEQLYRYLDLDSKDEADKPLSSKLNIKNRLDKLVKYRVLNKFMLTVDIVEDKILPEALEIYCLDLGGRYLLANYSNEDTTDWYATVNMVSGEIINKSLCVTEFYLSLISTCREKIVYFNVEPEIRVAKKNVVPSFDMCLNINGNKAYFVGEVVREYDFPVHFREKAFKLESLMESNAWKKYYYDAISPPVLFLFADSDIISLEVSKLITETTEMRRFRVSTDERMKRPLYDTGAFLKYVEEQDALKEIKSTTFMP